MLVAHARRAAYSSLRSSYVASSRALSYVAAIDQGTSSSRVILYDTSTLKPVASHQVELQSATSNPQPGWSQMDPMAILSTVATSAQGALDKAGAKASDVVGVGITNQRESTVVWDCTRHLPEMRYNHLTPHAHHPFPHRSGDVNTQETPAPVRISSPTIDLRTSGRRLFPLLLRSPFI